MLAGEIASTSVSVAGEWSPVVKTLERLSLLPMVEPVILVYEYLLQDALVPDRIIPKQEVQRLAAQGDLCSIDAQFAVPTPESICGTAQTRLSFIADGPVADGSLVDPFENNKREICSFSKRRHHGKWAALSALKPPLRAGQGGLPVGTTLVRRAAADLLVPAGA